MNLRKSGREEYIDRVKDTLVLGQGWHPNDIPPDEKIGELVDEATDYVAAGGMGWSVVMRVIDHIKRAKNGPDDE